MKTIAVAAVLTALCAALVGCTGDDTVQESVDGGYFPSDATAYDSTVASEDAGEDAGVDAMNTTTDAGHDATTTDASDGGVDGGGAMDSGNDAGVDGGGSVDSGEDAAG